MSPNPPIRRCDDEHGQIFVLVALILFIQRRPRGLFPQTGRAAEGA